MKSPLKWLLRPQKDTHVYQFCLSALGGKINKLVYTVLSSLQDYTIKKFLPDEFSLGILCSSMVIS